MIELSSDPVARAMELGIYAGANYASVSASTINFAMALTTGSASGLSYSGGLNLSFLQDHWLGFRVNGDFADVAAQTGSYSYSAKTLFSSASIDINFDAFHNRHSLGIGGGEAFAMSPVQSLGGGTLQSQNAVILLEGKDWWKTKAGNIFVTVKWYSFLNSVFSSASILTGGLGFEF